MPFPEKILHKKYTSSTMDDAREALSQGYGHGTVCLADQQDAGRGRLPGRRWENGQSSLLFTLILEKSRITMPYPLTQLLALALCRYLEGFYGLAPLIKWPNDVMVNSTKIAGILVEREGDYLLGGIGLNINLGPGSFVFRGPAVSLSELIPCVAQRTQILQDLLVHIETALDEAPPVDSITRRLAYKGEMRTVLLGDPSDNSTVRGKITGLNDDGALLVTTEAGKLVQVYSGEIMGFL